MKQNLQITLTVLSGAILAGLPAGCPMPTKEGIAKNTTEYNMVAEKAGNEMLLLNIVRASKRRPMYFTSFGKLTGQMSFEVGTGSINIPFGRIGGGLNGSYSIAPNAGYKYSPLFDLSVLDTQEFTRGIMAPVPMKTFEYYWSQGWPKEMLLHLFIRRIEIKDPNDPNFVKTYDNDPEDPCDFTNYQKQISTKKWKWEIEEANATSIGDVNANEALKLQNLIEVHKAGLTLTEVKNNNKAQEKDKDEDNNKMKLCLSQAKYVFTREPNDPNDPIKKTARKKKYDKMTIEEKMHQKITLSPRDSRPGNMGNKLQITIYLRSPEAILYYLGEIMRAENRTKDPNIPMIPAGSGECKGIKAKLFYALDAPNEDVTPCVSVDYEGTKYVIPGDPNSYERCCEDRSMHVLSLVSQLIGLQKKSSEAPATATVSVIGR